MVVDLLFDLTKVFIIVDCDLWFGIFGIFFKEEVGDVPLSLLTISPEEVGST